MSYISLFNQNEITGDIISNNIIISGSIDFTNASIIGLVDNITTALINSNSQIQVKDGGITDIKIVSMSATKLTGYISISGSIIYFILSIDLGNNNISNVNTLITNYITLNGSDLNTRLVTDELDISNLKSQMITANSNIYNLQLKTQYFNTSGYLTNNLLPSVNNSYDIGSSSYIFRNGYFNSLIVPTINYSTGPVIQYNGNNILSINSDGITLDNYPVAKIYVASGSQLQIGMNSSNTYFYSNVNLSNNQLLGCSFGSINTVNTNYIDYNSGTPILLGTLAPSIEFASPININNQAITNVSSIASATNIQFNNNLLPNANNTLNIGSASLGLSKIYCATLSAATSGLTFDGNGGNIIFKNNIIPFSNNSLTFGTSGYALSNVYTIDLNLNGTSLSSRLSNDESNIYTLQLQTQSFNVYSHLINTLIPQVSNTYDLGSSSYIFRTGYFNSLNLNGSDLNTRLTTDETNITTLQNKTQYQSATGSVTTFTGSLSCPTYTTTGNMTLSVTGANTITLSTGGTSIITNTQINMSNQGIYNCNTLTGMSGSGLLLDGNGSNIILNNNTIPNANNTISLGSSTKAMQNVYCSNLKAGNSGLTVDGSGGNIVYNSTVIPNANNTLNLGAAGYAFANVYSIDYNLNGTSLNTSLTTLNNKTQYLNTSGQQTSNFIPSSTTSYTLGDSSHLWNGIYSSQDMISFESNTFPVLSLTANVDNQLSFPVTNGSLTTSNFTVNTSTAQFQYTGPNRTFNFNIMASVSAPANNVTYIFRLHNSTQSVDLLTRAQFATSGIIYGLTTISGIMRLFTNDILYLELRPSSTGNYTFYNIHVSAFALLN